MWDLVKKIMPYIIIVGTFVLVIGIFLSMNTTILTQTTTNGVKLYELNLYNYMTNISNTWDGAPTIFENVIPSRQFDGDIINNLALLFDYLYMPINLLLWPIRFIGFLGKMVLAFVGFETAPLQDGRDPNQVVAIFSWISKYLYIPYV